MILYLGTEGVIRSSPYPKVILYLYLGIEGVPFSLARIVCTSPQWPGEFAKEEEVRTGCC